jgi:hypothetical protein
MNLGDIAFLVVKACHPALIGRRNFHQGLVGHYLSHRLIFFDHIAFTDQPFDQFTFHDTFADIGQNKITHSCSPVLISA